jgi:hypothetical protein
MSRTYIVQCDRCERQTDDMFKVIIEVPKELAEDHPLREALKREGQRQRHFDLCETCLTEGFLTKP